MSFWVLFGSILGDVLRVETPFKSCVMAAWNNLLTGFVPNILLTLLEIIFLIVLDIKTIFKGIAGGIVIASAFEFLRRDSTYDQLVSAINTCVLPDGAQLIKITEGGGNLKVQTEHLLALDNLWRMYKNETLKARLEALFITDEMLERARGGVEVIVTIDQQEYEKARDELTTEARGNQGVTKMTPRSYLQNSKIIISIKVSFFYLSLVLQF